MNENIINYRRSSTEHIKNFIAFNLADTGVFDDYQDSEFDALVNIAYLTWLRSNINTINLETIAKAMAFIQEQEDPIFLPSFIEQIIAEHFWD